jgi:hypothetical protein
MLATGKGTPDILIPERRYIYEESIGGSFFTVVFRGIIIWSCRLQEGRGTETGPGSRSGASPCARADASTGSAGSGTSGPGNQVM